MDDQLIKSKRGRPKKVEKIPLAHFTSASASTLGLTDTFHVSGGSEITHCADYFTKTYVVHLMITKDDITNMSMRSLDTKSRDANMFISSSVCRPASIDYSYICRSLDVESSKPMNESYYPNKYICVTNSNIPIQLLESVSSQKYIKHELVKQNVPSELIAYTTDTNGQLEWPSTSKYACWNCDMNFNGYPIGIPERESDGKFYCYGNFCWFPCALRYLLDRTSDHSTLWQKNSLLNALYNIATPDINGTDDIQVIVPAPP